MELAVQNLFDVKGKTALVTGACEWPFSQRHPSRRALGETVVGLGVLAERGWSGEAGRDAEGAEDGEVKGDRVVGLEVVGVAELGSRSRPKP